MISGFSVKHCLKTSYYIFDFENTADQCYRNYPLWNNFNKFIVDEGQKSAQKLRTYFCTYCLYVLYCETWKMYKTIFLAKLYEITKKYLKSVSTWLIAFLIYTHAHIHNYTYPHTHTHTHTRTYIYIYLYIYMYVCIYIYIFIGGICHATKFHYKLIRNSL